MTDSTDESSDSESEYFVSREKINLNSSFFTAKAEKSKTCEISDDSDEFTNVNDDDNAVEVFSKVLQNLKSTEEIECKKESPEKTKIIGESRTTTKVNENVKSSQDYLSKHVNDLLYKGEHKTFNFSYNGDSSDEETIKDETAPVEYSTPAEGVKITLPGTELLLKKKKNNIDLKTLIKNRINQRLRANQIFVHKAGILCWLAHGFHLNKLANEPEIMSMSLSLIASNSYPNNRTDLSYLEKFTKWFKTNFKMKQTKEEAIINKEVLLKRLSTREILNDKELILLYIATLRAIGLNSRLIMSLYPPPLKPQQNQLFKTPAKEENNKKEPGPSKLSKEKQQRIKSSNEKTAVKEKAIKKECTKDVLPENCEDARKVARFKARERAALILQKKDTEDQSKQNRKNIQKDDSSKKSTSEKKQDNTVPTTKLKDSLATKITRNTRSKKMNLNDHVDNSIEDKSLQSLKSDDAEYLTSINTNKRSLRSSQRNISKPQIQHQSDNDSIDSDFVDFKVQKPVRKKANIVKCNSKVKDEKPIKLLSSDTETDETDIIQNHSNVWVEVYLESEENWICVDVVNGKIHCITEIYKKASKPVLYIIAWNIDERIKDVTKRYCPHWFTVTRKQRTDEKWFQETLSIWKEKPTYISRAEDKLLLQKDLEQPLPKTISECKGHPLYALVRHLLKYEALYPPDCVPLGYLQNREAIYSRHCVHTLCSRETWVKKARVVKPAQKPYKIVKALPKYDKLSGARVGDRTLELFGKWQTTEYVPPHAKDGIVPRNEYGNVDLFKQCMLPKGTVHIELPGLNRIAKKLDIDCAPAVVGFKFGCMGAVPAFEGFVVCSEYEDTLREAWETEQINAAKRCREKREKRIYGNWKKLIDGLRIKEKLANKYEFQTKDTPTVSCKRTKQKKSNEKRHKPL